MKNDARPLDMLEWATTIRDDRRQSLAIASADNDVDGLGHEHRFAQPSAIVNLKFASVH